MRTTSRALLSILAGMVLMGLLPAASASAAAGAPTPEPSVEASVLAEDLVAAAADPVTSLSLGAGDYHMCAVQQPSGALCVRVR